VEKLGCLPTEVVIDSRERRKEILEEFVELDIASKQADDSRPDEL
jgi:hypothetical protein